MAEVKDNGDKEIAILDSHIAALEEHFDTVQIFVSRQTHYGSVRGGSTRTIHRGGGNWYARYGQVRGWMLKFDHQEATDEGDD